MADEDEVATLPQLVPVDDVRFRSVTPGDGGFVLRARRLDLGGFCADREAALRGMAAWLDHLATDENTEVATISLQWPGGLVTAKIEASEP